MKGPTSGGTGRGSADGSGDDTSNAELRAILDGLSQVLEEVFDRLDDQARALHKLTAALEALEARSDADKAARAAADPDRVAAATAQATSKAVRDAFMPNMAKLVDVLETLTGGKALLRERMRAMDREEARQGRWRYQPWAVVVGIPLALVTVLALTVPRAAAQFAPTGEATGGEWLGATDNFGAACMYPKDGQDQASAS